MMEIDFTQFNRLIVQPEFEETLLELSQRNVFLPHTGEIGVSKDETFSVSGQVLTPIEDISTKFSLNPSKGMEYSQKYTFSAYDESFIKYLALEGIGYFTSHAVTVVAPSGTEYIPVSLITFYFYTRSNQIAKVSKYIKFVEDPEVASVRDRLKDKVNFLSNVVPSKSLLFVDGPLIGGDLYTIIVNGNTRLLDKDIVPIFFVKNSSSNRVTSSIPTLKGKYNSDMHWLNTYLNEGERSCLFKYEDPHNKENSMVFFYLKSRFAGPQRVEMHLDTYQKYEASMDEVFDLIYYLMLAQGSSTNPQLRPIAIAEAYAREVLKVINVTGYIRQAKFTPTLNQIRWGDA